jgi:hypothetical protein
MKGENRDCEEGKTTRRAQWRKKGVREEAILYWCGAANFSHTIFKIFYLLFFFLFLLIIQQN